MKGKRKKKRIIIALILLVIATLGGILYMKSQKKEPELSEKDANFSVNEYWWISSNQSRKDGSEDFNYKHIKVGDVVYDGKGYKLIVDSVKEHSITLRQEGGLVLANEDGSLNAFESAKDTYVVEKDKPLKLRSYSLRVGVILEINY